MNQTSLWKNKKAFKMPFIDPHFALGDAVHAGHVGHVCDMNQHLPPSDCNGVVQPPIHCTIGPATVHWIVPGQDFHVPHDFGLPPASEIANVGGHPVMPDVMSANGASHHMTLMAEAPPQAHCGDVSMSGHITPHTTVEVGVHQCHVPDGHGNVDITGPTGQHGTWPQPFVNVHVDSGMPSF